MGSTGNDIKVGIEVELVIYGHSHVCRGCQIGQYSIAHTVLRVWNYVGPAYWHRKASFK